jgi:hypothetical protein
MATKFDSLNANKANKWIEEIIVEISLEIQILK